MIEMRMTKYSQFAGLLSLALFGIALPAAAQTTIFQETFNNGNATAAGQPIIVDTYTSPSGITYTGATNWLSKCNGLVTSPSAPVNSAPGTANCSNDAASWWGSGLAQRGVGLYTTNAASGAWFAFTAAQRTLADQSISITAYTSGAAAFPVGEVILQNVQPIAFPAGAVPPGGSGRFVTFQFVGGATNCDVGHPLVTVNLNGTQLGGTIDLCTSPASNVRTYGGIPMRSGFVSPNAAANTVRVGNYTPTGTGSALVMGGGLTFAMINRQASGGGNDWAWDNFTALDVSPSVVKTVDIASNYVGQLKRLTFTVTNTNGDNGPKAGWGFTDTLPGNAVIAPTPNATTTCGAGTTMTANAGDGTFTVAGGNLAGGVPGAAATTCTISLNVVSNTPGTFTNTNASYTSSLGLNIPNQSVPMTWVANTVTVTKISNGGTGTFNFSGSNGIAGHSIATTADGGAGTQGAQQTLVLASTTGTTTLTEAAAAGWQVTGTPSCTVNGATLAGTSYNAGTQTLTLPTLPLVAGAGRNVVCVFTNARVATTLAVTKVSNGGTGTFGFSGNNGIAAHSITTTAAGTPGTVGAQQLLTASGTATAISEDAPPAGWVLSNAACTVTPPNGTAAPAAGTFDSATRTFNLTVADTAGGNAIACTFTNDRLPVLTLAKTVVNDNGGAAVDTAWTLTATGPATISGTEGQAGITAAAVPVGTYTLSETGGPAGYALTGWACTNGVTVDASNQIALALGQTTVCTATNDDQPARLTLRKTVTNDNGGAAVNTAWTLTATGPTNLSGAHGAAAVTNVAVNPGAYTLAETNGPAGYAATGAYSCVVNGAAAVVGNNLTLAAGDNATCTITNDDQPAQLTLRKAVTNDNGGAAVNTAWTLTATGPTNLSGAHGAAAVTNAAVNPGTYTLAEANGPAGYAATGAYSCVVNGAAAVVGNSLTLAAGDNATCTITNDDQPAQLTLRKTVTNDNGGAAVNTAWTLTATGPTNLSGAHGAAAVTNAAVNPGAYTLAESNGPVGYAATGAYSCVVNGGAAVVGNNLTLAGGENAVCTITNDDQPARLTLRKTVVNNNGGTATAAAWTLTAAGPTNLSGAHGSAAVTNAAVAVGAYTLGETGGPGGYAASQYSCVLNGAAAVAGNSLTLGLGDNAVCTITNDDMATQLRITKVTEGGTGTFGFRILVASGALFNQSITTTAAGIPGTTGPTLQDNSLNNSGMVVQEFVPPAGFVLRTASCTVTRPDGTTAPAGTFSAAGRSVNLSAADGARGNQIACTFVNQRPPTVRVTKVSNGGTGTFPFGGSNGIANHSITTTADGGTGTQGTVQTLAAVDTATALTETVPAGWLLTGAACTVTPAGGSAAPAAGAFDPATATFNLTAADTAVGNAIACTFTNQRQSSLQLAKAWAAGSIAGDQVTIGATTGGSNNTVSFGATAPTAADSGAAVIVNVGDSITLPAETGANLANYTTTVACSGGHTLSGSDGQQSNTLTITSGAAAVCTYTNTPRTATLQLAKAWAAGSTAGHQISIGATTGGTNNTAAFNATAPNAANSGAAVLVTIGDTITLPAEAGTNAANYTTTLECSGGHTLSGTNGQQSNTLTITGTNAAVCTYTNTLRTTDLSITKTNTPANGPSDQAGDTVVAGANTTYRLVVTNNAAADVTGAVVRDTPQAGLNCPAGNAVTCSGAACPGTAITVGDLANGVSLGLLAAGESATLEFSCTVQ
ncbi:hypothetical protein ABIE09_004336 [Lysobacter enzymogenes]